MIVFIPPFAVVNCRCIVGDINDKELAKHFPCWEKSIVMTAKCSSIVTIFKVRFLNCCQLYNSASLGEKKIEKFESGKIMKHLAGFPTSVSCEFDSCLPAPALHRLPARPVGGEVKQHHPFLIRLCAIYALPMLTRKERSSTKT